jgi:hypothetical protein
MKRAAALLLVGACQGPPVLDEGVVQRPDPSRPWAGVVAISLDRWTDVWFVDGEPAFDPPFDDGQLVLDTTRLADGPHVLTFEIAGARRSTIVTVANGAASPWGGSFTDVTAAIGLGALVGPPAGDFYYAVGAVASDVDGDDRVDVFGWGQMDARLYRRDEDGTFAPDLWSMPPPLGAGFGDLDGDGRPELVTAGYDRARLFSMESPPVELPLPAPPGRYQGVTFVDLDEDGLLDLALAGFDCQQPTANVILRNEGGLRSPT